MPHRPAVYWADFLVSASVAWAALIVCLTAEMWSATQLVAFLVAGFLLTISLEAILR